MVKQNRGGKQIVFVNSEMKKVIGGEVGRIVRGFLCCVFLELFHYSSPSNIQPTCKVGKTS